MLLLVVLLVIICYYSLNKELAVNETEARLNSHEAVCAIRYEGINARLKKIEQILIGACGFIIAILTSIAIKL